MTKIKATLEAVIYKATNTRSGHGIIPKNPLKSIIISDSIILWIKYDPTSNADDVKSLRFLLHCVQQIQYECALSDIWLRGGVSHGEVLTDDKNIFGKGYISAYLLEQQADFPRVIFDVDTMKLALPNRNPPEHIKDMNQTFGCSIYNGKFLFPFPQFL